MIGLSGQKVACARLVNGMTLMDPSHLCYLLCPCWQTNGLVSPFEKPDGVNCLSVRGLAGIKPILKPHPAGTYKRSGTGPSELPATIRALASFLIRSGTLEAVPQNQTQRRRRSRVDAGLDFKEDAAPRLHSHEDI